MSTKMQFPMAVSAPVNAEGHAYQIVITPDGVFGRFDTKVKGRANRWAMYVEGRGHDNEFDANVSALVMRSGVIELDEDMVKEIVNRGYATGDEASVTNALKKAIDELPMTIHTGTTVQQWLDNVTTPSWTPEPEPVVVADPEPVFTADDAESVAVVAESVPVSIAQATEVFDAGSVSIAAALTVHDNAAAYAVPVAVEKWQPVKFLDTEIDAMDYLDRAKNGNWNIAITGGTGCGKSALCYNTAVKWQTPYAAIPFSEATDTTALWDEPMLIPDGKGGTRSVRVLTAAGMVAKYGGIMEWQEINGAADSMLTAIYGVLDFGRQITLSNGATIPLHKDTLIIATQNPVDAAHSHASHMSAALDRRFWHVEMAYDGDVEAKLVKSKALRALAKEIRSAGLQQPFGTDSLVKVDKAIADFGIKQGTTGLIHMFRDPAAREVLRPMVDVRLHELGNDYAQEVTSDVAELADADLDF